jgi:phage protein D
MNTFPHTSATPRGGASKTDFGPNLSRNGSSGGHLPSPRPTSSQRKGLSRKLSSFRKTRKLRWVLTNDANNNSGLPSQQQIKRTFKNKGNDSAAALRNLNLQEGIPRKKSEVQMYMILYYDTRIRQTVVKRWAQDRVEKLESRVKVTTPDNEIESHESFDLRDPKIPVSYKHAIAQQLYKVESETIKAEVRKQREAWHSDLTLKTVRTDDEDERLALVRQYHK